MDKVGILYHPKVEQARPLSEEILAWLAARGVAGWVAPTDADEVVQDHLLGSSLLVVLGGMARR